MNARATCAVLGRWLVGGMFVYMGLGKALDPAGFLKIIRQYDALHDPVLLNVVAATLPWFEVICGLLLLTGIAVRGAALVLTCLLVPFTALILRRAIALHTGVPFCAIKFDCGCGSGEVYVCRKLLENTGLILLCIWFVSGHCRKWSLRYELFGFQPQADADGRG